LDGQVWSSNGLLAADVSVFVTVCDSGQPRIHYPLKRWLGEFLARMARSTA
jgi:hypothetical protein